MISRTRRLRSKNAHMGNFGRISRLQNREGFVGLSTGFAKLLQFLRKTRFQKGMSLAITSFKDFVQLLLEKKLEPIEIWPNFPGNSPYFPYFPLFSLFSNNIARGAPKFRDLITKLKKLRSQSSGRVRLSYLGCLAT